ncbi:MAG: hypothetical protein WDW38_002671 [Sanguina aurantia]
MCQQVLQSPLEPANRSIPSPAPLTQEQQSQQDVRFMRLALHQGHLGAAAGEVPVGAVLVHDGAVIASAHNLTHSTHSPLAHAEMLCISRAAEHMQAWRLLQATLYVTIEPCPMCAGAILQSRLKRVVYGAPQPRMGCDGSWLSMFPWQDGRQGVGSHHSPQTKSEPSEVESSSRGTNADVAAESPGGQPPVSDQADEISLATTGKQTPDRPSGTARGEQRLHPFHPDLRVARGVLGVEAAALMQSFFKQRRAERPGKEVE